MLDKLSIGTLPAGWERLTADGDEDSLVARHETGASLYLWREDDTLIANLVQMLESDGYTVDVTTHAANFDQWRGDGYDECQAYIAELLESMASGEDKIEAIAIVGHDGSTSSVDVDAILDEQALIDPETKPPLADVFAVYPNRLPKRTTIDDVLEVRRELIAAVYGHEEAFDAFQVLESENMAYAGMTAEVFSVTEHSLEALSQDDD